MTNTHKGKAYIGTMDVNGDIDAADTTNGLKIDGTGSILNVQSIGGDVSISAEDKVIVSGETSAYLGTNPGGNLSGAGVTEGLQIDTARGLTREVLETLGSPTYVTG